MSRTKIQSLTPAQETQLLADRAEWLAVGRSCAPADRAAAAGVFVQMYAALSKPTPTIWWWDGPATAALARTLLLAKDANLGDNLGANLRANLRANLWANLWANLGANLGANLQFHFWGQHEAAWPVFYWWPDAHLRPMHTDEQRQRLGWWLTLARSVGWWEPYQGIVMACERPERQAVDAEGRLHYETGPALLCRDGFGVHAWHGVSVPAQVIEAPQTITAEQILKESNAEVRRVMVERVGYERFLGLTGAQRLQADDYGELFKIELPDDEPVVLVRVLNSTPESDGSVKPYLLRVPPQIERARDAVAWTFNVPSAEYVPVQQT